MTKGRRARPAGGSLILFLFFLLGAGAFAQGPTPAAAPPSAISALDLGRVRGMLKDAHRLVKEHYYDRKYHGVDLDARYREFDEQLNNASSVNAAMALVADFLDTLRDSHTYFYPPSRPYEFEYGYRLRVIGERVFISRVQPGSDADGKLLPGDQLISINGGRVDRESLRGIQYRLSYLQPQSETTLTVRSPEGIDRTVIVLTRVTPLPPRGKVYGTPEGIELADIQRQAREDGLLDHRLVEFGDVLIWKMPSFLGTSLEVDTLFERVRGHRALVLDMRRNPGGYTTTLSQTVGHLFTTNVTIGQRVKRYSKSWWKVAGTRTAFTGQLIVLVDAGSGSAAEILARVVQLEHRGTVIGDRSSGAVMEGITLPASQGGLLKVLYAFSVTSADLIMRDGRSIENAGVVPDELMLPSAADLAAGSDPVLARAAKLAGLDLDPVAAGRLFPVKWK